MLVDLAVPYIDTRAADLRFTLALPVQPALYALELPCAGVQLRLLGASHQVVWSDRPGVSRVETVACLTGGAPGLPRATAGAGHHFRSTVDKLDRAAVALLRAELATDPLALIGVFPGDPEAVTGLRVTPDGTGWQSWHAYPQTGELVKTWTTLEEAP